MLLKFPYPDIPPVEIPNDRLIGYYRPKRPARRFNPISLITKAIENPIGTPRLAEMVRPGYRVLILVDDLTRPTPQHVILPFIIAELHRGGVLARDISILFSYGSHRKLTREEKARKLGSELAGRFQLLDHDWMGDDLIDLGKLDDGTPIVVNRHLVEADFVLSVGHIVPHRAQGFTGGGKMVLPGAAGKASLDYMHWQEAHYHTEQILGQTDNPIRRISDAFARRAGLKFSLNVVLDDERNILGAWSGDPAKVYRKGCQKSKEIYGIEIPEPADICVTDSYPADVDLWQANKAIFAMDLAVKNGGVVILVTPCPEGAATEHPHLVDVGFRPHHEIKQMVLDGKLEAGASAAALSDVGRVIREKAKGILVSPGISPDVQRKLGFEVAGTPQEALDRAFEIMGAKSSVLAFHHGGEILPIVKGSSLVGRAGQP